MKHIDTEKIKARIGFSPHEKQATILASLKRHNVIVGGKRVGKTILMAYLALKELLATDRNIWIAAPTYDLAKRSWDYLDLWAKRFFPDFLKTYQAPEPKIFSITGSQLELKSAENEKSLLGKPLDLFIGDEAPRMDGNLYERYIRPNLIDRKGRSVLIGNPWGKNWFYDQYLMPNSHDDYFSFHLPTAIVDGTGKVIGSNNPANVSIEELERIRLTTPEQVWRQEYLAIFEEGAGQVFRGVEEAVGGEPTEPLRGHLYYLGVDLARLVDFTVLMVIDRAERRVVHFDRFKDIDWVVQKSRMVDLARRYNDAILVVDSTGVGDPIVEELKMNALVVEDFKYSKESKRKLIDKLSMLIQQKKLKYPRIQVLLDELEAFSFRKTSEGGIKYFSPSNSHDDCVNALALAAWKLEDEESWNYTDFEGIWGPRFPLYV